MKRLAAFIVAVALIGGGFAVYNRRTDPERGRPPLVLWCVHDAATACARVASGTVRVKVLTPLQMETALDSATSVDATSVDAIVTSAAWLERVDDRNKLKVSEPVASAPIVVATRAGSTICRDLPCLALPANRVALPKPNTLAASIVAAVVFAGKARDEIPSGQLDALRRGGPSTNGVEAMTALATVRLVDAVVTIKPATANVARVSVRAVSPSASIGLSIGWIREDPRLESLAKKLRGAFITEGWDSPAGSLPGPDSNAVVEAYGILNG